MGFRKSMVVTLVAFFLVATALAAERRKFKPARINFFSTEKDISLGRKAAEEVDKKFPILADKTAATYLQNLGRKLARYAPGKKTDYPWTFKLVNAEPINAFALPGGFIYVNRGTIEAAKNESELAGVLSHEIGHVVMRHSTNRASKAILAQGALGAAGGAMGGLAQLGIGFGLNSVMLKYSRKAETQSDQMATYILYDAGYDPRAMANFFQTLEKNYPRQTANFFSSHPSPGNRVRNVNKELLRAGPRKSYRRDSPAFQNIKQRLSRMAYPQKGSKTSAGSTSEKSATASSSSSSSSSSGAQSPPPAPSSKTRIHEGEGFTMEVPDNWPALERDQETAFFPKGGMIQVGDDPSSVGQAYGAIIGYFEPPPSDEYRNIEQLTDEFVTSLRRSNPDLRVTPGSGKRIRVDRRTAYSLLLENSSPLAGRQEKDWLVTVRRPAGLFYAIFIAPQKAFPNYRSTFEMMVDSIEFR